jgi:NADH dehydrogenase [ubiquinone] 1 alpha subcomplex assembly factor 5
MAFQVFDRHVKKLQKDRAAAQKDQSRVVDYLKDEVAARVSDRLLVSRMDKKEKGGTDDHG